MPSFVYKESFSDHEAPVLTDVYFSVDGSKCDNAFTAESGQEVIVNVALTDASEIDIDNCWVTLGMGSYDETSIWFDNYNEETGYYEAAFDVDDLESGDWHINSVRLEDKYSNTESYATLDGDSLAFKYFMYGVTSEQEASFEVYFITPGSDDWEEDTVTTTRITTLADLGIEMPTLPEVNDAEFVGWKTKSGQLITSDDQQFAMETDSYTTFTAVYDKQVIKINASYNYGENTAYLYFGIEEGTTWGELLETVEASGYLEPYETEYDGCVFYSWSSWYESDEVIADSDETMYLDANYRESYVREFTFDANGGAFSDGSTSMTMELDIYDGDVLSTVEEPTYAGYVFAGWCDGDGCSISNLEESCTSDLYAKWVDASDAAISYAYIKYATVNDVYEDETGDVTVAYSHYYIWEGEETATVSLPFNVHPDYVELYVKKNDGTAVTQPIELQNGNTDVTYESASADGSNVIVYTADIEIEETPEHPSELWIKYYVNGESEWNYISFDESKTASAELPYSYDAEENILISWMDVDGKTYEGEFQITDDQNEYVIDSVNGSTYTIDFVVLEASADTGVYFELMVSSGDFFDYIWIDDDELNNIDEDGYIPVTVPYGTITETDDYENEIRLEAYTDSRYATTDMYMDSDYGGYRETLTPDENGEIIKEVTVTAENGDTKVYKLKLVEDAGDEVGVYSIRARFWDGESYYEEEDPEYVYEFVTAEDAASAEGATVIVPYKYDAETGIQLTCYYEGMSTVDGLLEKYELNDDGTATATFTVTSPNGKNTETYTINFVKDNTGDVAELESYALEWETWTGGDSETGTIYADVDDAATEAGATVKVPANIFEAGECYFWGEIKAKNYGTITYTEEFEDGDSYTYNEVGSLYVRPELLNNDSDTIEFTITSANGEVTKNYKINFVKVDAVTECVTHTYGDWAVVEQATCTAAGVQKHTCTVCGAEETAPIPATGHTAVKDAAVAATCTTAGLTEGSHCSVCNTVLTAQQTVAATGHAWNKTYTVDKAATIKAPGSKSIHCADCDAKTSVTKIVRIKKTTANTLVYNGKKRTQNVTVVDFKGKKLVKGKDFTVTYKNAKGTKVVTPKLVGTYKAVVKFKGDYSGTVTKTFKITPKGTTLKTLTKPAKKQIKVTWKKQTVQVTGYQIRYSTNKNMKNSKIVTVAKAKTTTKTIKKLKSKKKYYVQIRTYKTVNGVKHFSAWSAKKFVTTK